MKKYKADVIVKLKNGVRDPQGTAVDTVLRRTGLEEASEVKVGKYFSLSVTAQNESEARQKLDRICEDVLSNPVLEKYEIERLIQA
jgi:phosphoribosylformylglycinamidine synthase